MVTKKPRQLSVNSEKTHAYSGVRLHFRQASDTGQLKRIVELVTPQGGKGEWRALKVLRYARVSTEDQRKHGTSMDEQQRILRAYVKANNLELVEPIIDVGRSGASVKRPGMERLLERVAAGGIDSSSRSTSTGSAGTSSTP